MIMEVGIDGGSASIGSVSLYSARDTIVITHIRKGMFDWHCFCLYKKSNIHSLLLNFFYINYHKSKSKSSYIIASLIGFDKAFGFSSFFYFFVDFSFDFSFVFVFSLDVSLTFVVFFYFPSPSRKSKSNSSY